MFGISFGEFVIIFTVALVVIGPQKLPEMIRTVGSLIHKIRSFTDQVKDDVSKEFQIDDLKQSFLETKNDLTNQVKSTTNLDSVKKSLYEAKQATENSIRDAQKSIDDTIKSDLDGSAVKANTSNYDSEAASDIAEYYNDYQDSQYEMTAPPKGYAKSLQSTVFTELDTDTESLLLACQARQFELFSQNEEDKFITYHLKYSKPRELNSLSNIIDNYYDTQVDLNHR